VYKIVEKCPFVFPMVQWLQLTRKLGKL